MREAIWRSFTISKQENPELENCINRNKQPASQSRHRRWAGKEGRMNQIISKHQQMSRFRPKMDNTRVECVG